jgi:hypothetical protein
LNHAIHTAAVTQISHHTQGRSTTTRNWTKARPRKKPSEHSRGASRTPSTGG